MWLIIDVAFVAALGLAIAYGTVQWRKRSRAAKVAGERATQGLYHGEKAMPFLSPTTLAFVLPKMILRRPRSAAPEVRRNFSLHG